MGKVLIAHPTPPFCIVVFPDQGQAVANGDSWDALHSWVVTNKTSRNILAVLTTGDLTLDNAAEDWDTLLEGCNEIAAAGVAVLPIVGNHDYDSITARTVTSFNAHFGPSWFSGKNYYGASTYPASSNANYYITFDYGDKHWIILALETFPRAAAIAWAAGVIEANPTRDIVIVTHGYMNNDSGLITYENSPEGYGPLAYFGAAPKDANGGDELWTELVKLYVNIRLVICAHQIDSPPFVNHVTAVGDNSNNVYELFTNYQGDTNGGNGHCILLNFSSGQVECIPYKTRATEGEDSSRNPKWTWSW